jgi:hypothetical protein
VAGWEVGGVAEDHGAEAAVDAGAEADGGGDEGCG